MLVCKYCGKRKSLRFGGCFDCATFEVILVEGLGMYDKGLDGTDVPAITVEDKIKLLQQSGWEAPADLTVTKKVISNTELKFYEKIPLLLNAGWHSHSDD